jgi:hypothetical protein
METGMTAETDIAAIDDGGANTAAEVRTALTSVLARADGAWSPILSVKGSVDDPPDDEFDDSTGMSGAVNGLDAKWTAVSGTSGTVSITETGEVEKYDLTSRPGWLLMQAGSSADQKVELRQDFTLGDGDSIVLAMATPWAASDGQAGIVNNELWTGLCLNTSDAGYDQGTFLVLLFDTNQSGIRLLTYDGTNFIASTSESATPGMHIPVGQLIYLRMIRASTVIHCFWSADGSTWMPMGSDTISPTNIWLFAESTVLAGEPVPVVAVYWVRQGGNGFDPW